MIEDDNESLTVMDCPSYSQEYTNSSTYQKTESGALLDQNMKEKFVKLQNAIRRRNLIVDCLSILFGIGSWIGINSMFLQVPLLVKTAPEGWSLPSYLVVIIQIGNIGPISYTLIQKFASTKIRDSYMIYTILIIGTIAALLTSFLYNKTTTISNGEYSVPLFILVFFLALVGCTSSVLFMPYMGRFQEIYLITYLIGEGLSGFVPSIVASIQGAGGTVECVLINTTDFIQKYERITSPPNFGTMEFFFFVSAVMLCSFVAFTLLDQLKVCKSYYAATKIEYGNNYEYDTSPTTEETNNSQRNKIRNLSNKDYKITLIIMGFVCVFGNAIFPSIQSYSCLPYGNKIYHLTVIATLIVNPLACFLAFFLPHTAIRGILAMIGLSGILGCFIFVTAILSSNSFWVGTSFGGPIIVIVWTLLMGTITYTKLCITTMMRAHGGKSLVWTGAVSQTGSAIGSIIIFILINFTQIFVSNEPC